VEGLAKFSRVAVITDVVYSSESKILKKEEEKEEKEQESEGGKKAEYDGLVSEILDKERELKHLQLKVEVLAKEKELMNQFAGHMSTVMSSKVGGSNMSLAYLYFCFLNSPLPMQKGKKTDLGCAYNKMVHRV